MATRNWRAPSIALSPLQTGLFTRGRDALERIAEAERDQFPLWLPVGLGLGISAWFALPDEGAWTAFLLVALGIATGAAAIGWASRWGRAIAIFSLVAAMGCGLVWIKAEAVAAPRLERARMAEFTARVENVQKLPAREAVRLIVGPLAPTDLPSRLRINVDEKAADDRLQPGATVRLKAWLMPPAPMAVPGAYDFAQAAWFQGIGGTGRASRIELIAPPAGQDVRQRLAATRQALADHVRTRIEGGPGAIAAALATGDQAGIPEEDAEAMRASGLAHLLSVSGLHLTAVVGAVMLLTLKLMALSPTLALRFPLVLVAAGAGALAGIAYTLLTGAEVPTIRACVAALLILLALALGREALTLRLLAVGALIVLLFWPETLAGPSFQLSFAAITAIVALHEHPRIKALLSRREEGFLHKTGRGLLALILTGLLVEIALMPIALYHFHKSGLYGALANVVAIPLTTFIVMPLEALALLLDVVGMGTPVWWLAGVALNVLLALAHAVADAPGAVASLPTMPRGAFALVVGGGLWLALWRTAWRRLGLVPIAAGFLWAFATPAPDLIVTGDGKHLALRTGSGGFAILRSRAGDYVRDMLGETAGEQEELSSLEDVVPCSPDLCRAAIVRDGRIWHVLATRSPHHVEWRDMVRACAEADIVVSDRMLPRGCVPRWLKADRVFLERTGGLAISLGDTPRVNAVRDLVGEHPWAVASRPAAR